MPPQMSRRGSIALTMLDNQSLAPRLESVLSSVNPPSEDAAFEVSCGLHDCKQLVLLSLPSLLLLLFVVNDRCVGAPFTTDKHNVRFPA